MREVKSKKEKGKKYLRPLYLLVCLFAFAFLLSPPSAFAQSSDQNFPTHVTSNEINGRISARTIGDARLTTLFYLFEGSQGDIFINVATTNFTGDIDIYATDSMKPLTKMVMYADAGRSETGRLIYLRQSARLLLRIEGRTPNDDAATFRIKFAGSFVALAPETYEPAPTVAGKQSAAGNRQSAAKTDVSEPPALVGGQSENPTETPTASDDAKLKTEDTVYENKSAKVTVKPTAKPTTKRRTTTAARGGNPSGSAGASSEKPTAKQKPKAKTPKPKTETPKPPSEPDPLANVNLVVVFKDGTVIERPMTEISRFSFDNGRLTVVEKNGTITRYQMTTIAKVTIE
ncbi:MAG: hypothetical protein WBD16_07005 [Pyrinomonadaceae bacterium]